VPADDTTARLFIGLALPDAVRAAIAARTARAVRGTAWRASHPDTLHVTVRFLGDTPLEGMAAVADAVRAAGAATPAFEIVFGPASGLPPGRPARVAVLPIVRDLDVLAGLYGDLERRLVAAGVAAEVRAFRPHLTVARCREPQLAPAGLPSAAPAEVTRLVLWRSLLGGPHARHVPLAQAVLGGAGGPP